VTLPWRFAAIAAVLALTACSTGAPKTAPAVTPAPNPVASVGPPRRTTVMTPVMTQGSPGCSTKTTAGPRLPAADVQMSPVSGDPFGVVVTPDGRWSFVSSPLSSSAGPAGGWIGVFADAGSAAPKLVRSIPAAEPLGVAITHDGRYLLAASGSGAMVLSVQQAEEGVSHHVLGTLRSGETGHGAAGGGAIEVAVSPDDRFAFVSLEGSSEIAVFNLPRALASGFRTSGFVGYIPTGIAPVGLAVAPGGRLLYATSEVAPAAKGGSLRGGQGTLSVIDLNKAETDPAHSVVAVVAAGCSPVRVITSADGSDVWVTARESDALLAFSAARLLTDPAHSLIARVEVGEAPVGLALADGGQRIVIADSNRFGQQGASSNLAVVNVAAALAGKPALAGYLPAGGFPRQMALEPNGRTLLVTDFTSRQLETVDVANLP
jgi:DNA-binding beta-propeller fold protein YncE